MKRRILLLAGAASGALVLGWSLLPPRQRRLTAAPLPVEGGEAALNGWVKIAPDDSVTVMMARSEMGQGVHTGLAMLLAEELDADWPRVRVQSAPLDAIYHNLAGIVDGLPFHPDDEGRLKRVSGWMVAKLMREVGTMMTGGSSSLKDLWLPMREAGACARAMLLAAAAAQWGVPVAQCQAERGRVLHAPSGRAARFGELAALAARQPQPDEAPLKDPARFTLIGQPLPRLEAASKGDGSARFAIDARPPGLLHAAVTMCPTLGGSVARFDAGALAGRPGIHQVLAFEPQGGGSGGVAVIADSHHQAQQALREVSVEWRPGAAAGLSSDALMDQLARSLDDADGHTYHRVGDPLAALVASAQVLSAEYRAPWLAHHVLEPANCTVRVDADRASVWAPTQMPMLARDQVARLLGIDAARVELHVPLLGGGFGRRLEVDFITQAAAIARAMPGRPVQTLWSREQDLRHDFYRPACVARLRAGLDAQGRLLAWQSTSAGQAILPQVLARSFGLPAAGPDKTTAEGAFDQPYEWPAARIAHRVVPLPLPVGFWRSVGHSHQAFFKECFLDEVAHAARQDPVALRLALLQRHPRQRAVLERAAARAGWGQPLAPAPDGAPRARGVALHASFGSVVAQVAEVSLAPAAEGRSGAIRVHRVVCVVDCGRPVNPNLIRQQMEGAIVFGLSAALHGGIDIVDGQVRQSNFHDAPLLRIDACPAIEVDIVASEAPPEGVGEPGTPPVAPAVANALFALTGRRLRSLPLRLA